MRESSWALVLGGGASVWSDVAALEELIGEAWPGVIVAANDIGCHWRRHLEHWVTLTPERMTVWLHQRRANGWNVPITWTRTQHVPRTYVDHMIEPWGDGSSGLLAGQVAHELGCARVVFCGVPMTTTGHFPESSVHRPGREWKPAARYWPAWTAAFDVRPDFRERFRSMSGRTQELLGAPTRDWLHESSTPHLEATHV